VIIPLTSKKLVEIYRYEVRAFADSKHGKTLIDQIKTIEKKIIEKSGTINRKREEIIQKKLLAIFDL
jgi:mRNA-degrading endonuclease toxin of MazEF toxin-antitoxin module